MTTNTTATPGKPPPSKTTTSSNPLTLTVDTAEFIHYLNGSDWSYETKCAFLQTCWDIICDFVRIGFHVHPVQIACGQVSQTDDESAVRPATMVKSDHTQLIADFIENTSADKVRSEEGTAP